MSTSDATSNQYLVCKYARYKSIRNFSKDFVSFKLNLKKIRKEDQNMRHNILLGSSKPCKCQECNPDTANFESYGWFREEYQKVKDTPEFKKEYQDNLKGETDV